MSRSFSKNQVKKSSKFSVSELPPPAWQGTKDFGKAPRSLLEPVPEEKNFVDASTQTYIEIECSFCQLRLSEAKEVKPEPNPEPVVLGEIVSNSQMPRSSTFFNISKETNFQVMVEKSFSDADEKEAGSTSWADILAKTNKKASITFETDSCTSHKGNFKRYTKKQKNSAEMTTKTDESTSKTQDSSSKTTRSSVQNKSTFNSREFLDKIPSLESNETPSRNFLARYSDSRRVNNPNFDCSDTNIWGNCILKESQKPEILLDSKNSVKNDEVVEISSDAEM